MDGVLRVTQDGVLNKDQERLQPRVVKAAAFDSLPACSRALHDLEDVR